MLANSGLRAQAFQSSFAKLVIPQMCSHQNFPESAVIGHEEVQEFMDNHVVPEILVEPQQFLVEIEVAIRRTGRPFVVHGAHAKPDDVHIQLHSPLLDAALESLLLLGPFRDPRVDLPSPVERTVHPPER